MVSFGIVFRGRYFVAVSARWRSRLALSETGVRDDHIQLAAPLSELSVLIANISYNLILYPTGTIIRHIWTVVNYFFKIFLIFFNFFYRKLIVSFFFSFLMAYCI